MPAKKASKKSSKKTGGAAKKAAGGARKGASKSATKVAAKKVAKSGKKAADKQKSVALGRQNVSQTTRGKGKPVSKKGGSTATNRARTRQSNSAPGILSKAKDVLNAVIAGVGAGAASVVDRSNDVISQAGGKTEKKGDN